MRESHAYIIRFGGYFADDLSETMCRKLLSMALRGRLRLRLTLMNSRPWKYAIEAIEENGEHRILDELEYVRLTFYRQSIETIYKAYELPNTQR
jgi:hypothetical protein